MQAYNAEEFITADELKKRIGEASGDETPVAFRPDARNQPDQQGRT